MLHTHLDCGSLAWLDNSVSFSLFHLFSVFPSNTFDLSSGPMISWWPSCPNTEIWISSSLMGEIMLGESWHVIVLMAYCAETLKHVPVAQKGCLFITDKNKFVICVVDNCQQIHQKTRFGPAFLWVWHPYVAAWRQENSRRHLCGWRLWLVSAQPNVCGVRHQLSRRPCDQHEAFLCVHATTCRGETPKYVSKSL